MLLTQNGYHFNPDDDIYNCSDFTPNRQHEFYQVSPPFVISLDDTWYARVYHGLVRVSHMGAITGKKSHP